MKVLCVAAALTLAVQPCLADPAMAAPEAATSGELLVASGWNGMDCDPACVAALMPKHWLALVPGKNGWSLVPARLSFDDVDAKGIQSGVDGAEFYLAHPALVAGHAPTPDMHFKGTPHAIKAGSPLRISFGGRSYELALERHAVVLRGAGRTSTVNVVDETFDDTVLVWAGDLDGDGWLDLIVDVTTEKNGRYCLLLSSEARKPGELVRSAACQFFSG